VNSALPPRLFFLKLGYLARPAQKESKCLLKVSQSLLKWNAANLVKKLQVVLLLPQRQHSRCFAVPNPFLLSVPRFCPGMQSFVVDQPNATQCTAQELFLFRRWVKAVAVCSLGHASHFTRQSVKPFCKDGVSTHFSDECLEESAMCSQGLNIGSRFPNSPHKSTLFSSYLG
jgi:hypothetical protein